MRVRMFNSNHRRRLSLLSCVLLAVLCNPFSCCADEEPTKMTSSSSSSSKTTGTTATYRLNDGRSMPQIGLGVHQSSPGDETYNAVRWALDDVGYRLVDTAAVYENEADVGRAVFDSSLIGREDVFITTKLGTESHGYQAALKATGDQLKLLKTSYVDLLLIHSPFGGKLVETWDALLHLRQQGKARSIGVSNFGIKHLEALLQHGRPMPAVNQIEMHPLIFAEREDLIEYCHRHSIVVTAYGSLFYGQKDQYNHPLLQKLSTKCDKTIPQILLRWALQNNFAIIPKTTSSIDRLRENFDVFEFTMSEEDVRDLSYMSGKPLRAYWNPVKDADVHIGDVGHYRIDKSSATVPAEEL